MRRPISGCGGATLGLRKAWFDVIAAIENDPDAASCYLKNHPRLMMVVKDDLMVSEGRRFCPSAAIVFHSG